jgi:hypothetical protein
VVFLIYSEHVTVLETVQQLLICLICVSVFRVVLLLLELFLELLVVLLLINTQILA